VPEVRGKLWGVVLLLWIAPLFAVDIAGHVRDAATDLPVAGASIALGSRWTSSDIQGRFVFSNAISGEYRLTVTHVAYESHTETIVLRDGSNPPISILLTSKIYSSGPISTVASGRFGHIVISESAARSIDSFIEELPGVALIEGNGDIAVTIRGSRPEDVLVVVDGIPLMRSERGYCDLGTISSVPLRSVEVIADNVPAEYSSQAPAGVILIETAHRRENGLAIGLCCGSFGKIAAKGDLTIDIPMGFDIEITGAFDQSEGDFDYIASDTGATRQNNQREFLSIDARARRTGRLSDLVLSFGAHDLDEGMPGDIDHPTPTAFRRGNGVTASFKGNFVIPDIIDIEAKSSASKSERYYYIPRPFVYVPVDADHHVDSYRTKLSISKQIGNFEPSIGGLFYEEGYSLDNHLSEEMSIPRMSRDLYSYWIQGEYAPKIADLVSCNLHSSIRWDDADSMAVKRSAAIEGAASVAFYEITLCMSAGYSEALHLPEFADLYWIRDAFAEGNPDLAPETSFKRHISTSLNYENSWVNIYGGIDFFTRTIDSVIVWKRDFDGLYRPQNFAREETRGREDRFRARIFDAIELSWSNTTMTPIHRSDDRAIDSLWIPYKPGYSQRVGFKVMQFGVTAGLNGTMVGERYTLPANTKWTAAYELWDAFIEYTKEIGPIDAALRIEIQNAMDEDYEILNGFPMPGRSWRFGIDIKYSF